ncbi:MAG: hypothetical protein ACK4HE_09065 [Chitinophagaceae bacterium]
MKKAFVAVVLIAFVAMFATSCASNRPGVGCPTTNKKYFRA